MKRISLTISPWPIQIAFLTTLLIIFSGRATESLYGDPKQNIVQIAYIAEGFGTSVAHLAGCDTDHDDLEELLLYGDASVWLYEHTGNNQYELVLQLTNRGCWAAGDIDSDGLSDIVVQSFDSLEVFESPAPDSHPTHCVWQWEVPFVGNAAPSWITDLDQDSKREMLVSHMGTVYIHECDGDNSYSEVFQYFYPSYGRIANADFDGDGKREFVSTDGNGTVVVFENVVVGVDSFAVTWTESLPIFNAYAVAAANDMDQDGKPEFIVGGDRNFAGGRKFIFTVFETIGDDNYEAVWADSSVIAGILNLPTIACGDVDGDSIDEMLFGVDESGIYLYKCTGPDSYGRIWEWQRPYDIGAVLIYDLNQNGYGELVVSTPQGTWIFEKDSVVVQEMPDARGPIQEARLFQNHPNPCGHTTTISYSIPTGRRDGEMGRGGELLTYQRINLSVYDVAGRLVRTLIDEKKEPGIYSVTWDRKDETGRLASAGVYFYRLTAGGAAATRKMVVLK